MKVIWNHTFSQKRLSCLNIKSVFRPLGSLNFADIRRRSVTVTPVTCRTYISTHPRNVRQGSTMACLGWWMVQATTWPARAKARILSITQRAWEVGFFKFYLGKVIFEVSGGFNKPFEKHQSNREIFPNFRGEHNTNIWNHQLVRLVILRTCSDNPGICLKLSDFGKKVTFESIYLNKVSPIQALIMQPNRLSPISGISMTQKRKCQSHDMAGCMTSTKNTWIITPVSKRIMDIWGTHRIHRTGIFTCTNGWFVW